MTPRGMECASDGHTILLDPRAVTGDINFVSHAHADHLPTSGRGTVLASEHTVRLAEIRGRCIADHTEQIAGLTLYDTGHIMGSRGLLFGDTFYTGDICTRDRGFLRGARVPKCKTLITECTFGLPQFIFPPLREVVSQVNELISEMYARGVPVVLMGYALGKAQTLSQLFAHWEPIYYHDSVKKMNEAHRRWGVELKPALGHTEAQRRGLLDKKPWVMVSPMMRAGSGFMQDMKRYGAVTVSFSGWAGSDRFPYSRGADYSVPLSDHCDFAELVRLVKESGADTVYTIHGFVSEFADHLRTMGIDARPLAGAHN